MNGHSFYLTLPELYMLVGKSGADALYGFCKSNSGQPTDQELVFSMSKMIRKGLIYSNGEALVLNDELKKLIWQISSSEKCLTIRFSDPTKPAKCCYFGDTVVTTEQVQTYPQSSIRLEQNEKEDFVAQCRDWLKDSRAEIMCFEDFDDDLSEAKEYLAGKAFDMKQSEITSLAEVIWTVDLMDAMTGELIQRTILLDNCGQADLFTVNKDFANDAAYSGAELERQVKYWITGDDSHYA